MPANLTPQYMEADKRYRQAKTTEDKIAALEEMISKLPKHKGTDRIHGDLKSKLAKLKRAGEKSGGGPTRKANEYVISPEGAGQVVLLGAPNAGKSALLRALSNADAEVTDYPFSTHKPSPGMMRYEDVPFQLIDTPSIDPDFMDQFLPPLIRNADAAVLVVDVSSPDCLDQPGWIQAAMEGVNIELTRDPVSSTSKQTTPRNLPTLLAGAKADHPDGKTAIELLGEILEDRFPIVPVSVERSDTLVDFSRAVFDLFGIVRVYSKRPGKEADRKAPFLLPVGSTVLDFAHKVHKSFAERFSFARGWGKGKFEGQRLGPRDEVEDLDVIELHTS